MSTEAIIEEIEDEDDEEDTMPAEAGGQTEADAIIADALHCLSCGAAIDQSKLDALKTGHLRTLLRQAFASNLRFVGLSKTAVSQAINYASKAKLIEAYYSGELPTAINYATAAAAPTPEAPQATTPQATTPGTPNPMAFIQQALDAAAEAGRLKGLEEGKAMSSGISTEEAAKMNANLDKVERLTLELGDKLRIANEEKERAIKRAMGLEEMVRNGSGGGAPPAEGTTAEGQPATGGTPQLALQVVSGGGQGGISLPEQDPYYIISQEKMDILDVSLQRSIQTKMPKGVLLVGPMGCGKSTLPQQWSYLRGRPFFKANAALIREAKEWFGSKSAHDGNLFFILSEFCRALETPNCTVLIDEINRAIAQALNSLLGILDSGTCYVEELRRPVVIAPSVLVCASMNEGAEYSVHELDAALKDRFPVRLECDYLPEADEVKVIAAKAGVPPDLARKVVLMATTIREKHVDKQGVGGTLHDTLSTRQLIEIAYYYQAGEAAAKGGGKKSLEYTVTNRFNRSGGRSSEQCTVAQIVQGIFG